MFKIILIALALVGTTAQAQSWTTEERAWAATAGTFLLADWATTRYGSRHWDEGYYESNPILGRHPHQDRVDLYFLLAIPAVYLAADAFPEHRTLILQIVSGIELVAVGNNLRIGWKLNF